MHLLAWWKASICIGAALLLPPIVTASDSPLIVHNEIINSELKWMAYRSDDDSILKSSNDEIKGNPFFELGYVSNDIITEFSLTLYCTTFPSPSKSEKCQHYRLLPNSRVIMYVHEATKAIYFGYKFFVNYPPVPLYKQRLEIYKQADAAWSAIAPIINKHLDYQQFHVGYRSGGSIASLIAFRILTSKSLPFHQIKDNALNQVRVLTVSEISMFSNRLLFDPSGKANYANLKLNNAKRNEASSDTGYVDLGVRIQLPGPSSETSSSKREPNLSNKKLASYLVWGSKNIQALKSKKEAAMTTLQKFVKSEIELVQNVASSLTETFPDIIAHNLYGYEQFTCIRELQNELNRFLPHPNGTIIACRDKDEGKEKRRKSTFKIECALLNTQNETKNDSSYGSLRNYVDFNRYIGQYYYDTAKNVISHAMGWNSNKSKEVDEKFQIFASFTAKESQFDQECHKVCEYPHDLYETKGWNKCIQKLTSASPEIRLISPHENDSCRFIPGKITENWITTPKGFLVNPEPNSDLLHKIYKSNPATFYSFIATDTTEFPSDCQGILKPIPYSEQMLKKIEPVSKKLATYWEEMDDDYEEGNSSRIDKSLPLMFQKHSTPQFMTVKLKLSSGFLANQDTVNNLQHCASRHTKYLDCTIRANIWIPDACPEFCQQLDDAKEDTLYLCKAVKYCSEAKAHISLETYDMPYYRSKIEEQIKDLATPAQFALFHFTSEGYSKFLGIKNNYALVFFKQKPKVQRVQHYMNMRSITVKPIESDETDY